MKNKIIWIFLIVTFLAALYFSLFYRLGSNHVKIFDEARYAINAIEMQNSNNILINTFENKPDWWNSKPPLGAYIQSISIKIFGINELGLRFPSALFILLCVFTLILFSKKVLKDIIPGVVSSLVLISCVGIIRYHVGRTGDYDAFLVFFVLAYSLIYFVLVTNDFNKQKKTIYFGLFLMFLLFAYFTKGIGALIPIPGLLIFTIVIKKLKYIFSSWQFYFTFFAFFVLVLMYYFIREQYDNGYIKAVLNNELGMYSKDLVGKNRDILFYFKGLINYNFYPFAFFVPFSILSFYFTQNKLFRKIILFNTIFILFFLFIHSFSKTGNEWYDAPVYPFLALLFGLSLYIYYDNFIKAQKKILKYLIISLIFMFFMNPFITIINLNKDKDYPVFFLELEGAFMKKMDKSKLPYKNYTVCYRNIYKDQVLFYKYALEEKGYNIKLQNDINFSVGDTIASCQINNIEEINKKYYVSQIYNWDNCNLYKIDSLKN